MTRMFDIKEQLKKAMVAACNDMLMFEGSRSRKIKTEYLFTVNVAKAITKLNCGDADPYRVCLEMDAKAFARDCIKPILKGNPLIRGSTIFRSAVTPIDRPGRIDVAIYINDASNNSYQGTPPLCAIELKAFNPSRTVVLKDLRRNLQYLRLSGSTGRSVLPYTFFAALHAVNKIANNEQQLIHNTKEIKDRYSRWLAELGTLSDINVEVDSFTLSSELIGETSHDGYREVLDRDSRHHFIGVIICFYSKIY